jgi:hypothetical protein
MGRSDTKQNNIQCFSITMLIAERRYAIDI